MLENDWLRKTLGSKKINLIIQLHEQDTLKSEVDQIFRQIAAAPTQHFQIACRLYGLNWMAAEVWMEEKTVRILVMDPGRNGEDILPLFKIIYAKFAQAEIYYCSGNGRGPGSYNNKEIIEVIESLAALASQISQMVKTAPRFNDEYAFLQTGNDGLAFSENEEMLNVARRVQYLSREGLPEEFHRLLDLGRCRPQPLPRRSFASFEELKATMEIVELQERKAAVSVEQKAAFLESEFDNKKVDVSMCCGLM